MNSLPLDPTDFPKLRWRPDETDHFEGKWASFTRLVEPERKQRVLELGSLEGYWSFHLAQLYEQVVSVEFRGENIAKSTALQEKYGCADIQFIQADVMSLDFERLGTFDHCFNSGILYHVSQPWILLAKIRLVTNTMFLCTHVATQPECRVASERSRYDGRFYREGGLGDPLSGIEVRSFWPTEQSLQRMLKDCGFDFQTVGSGYRRNGLWRVQYLCR